MRAAGFEPRSQARAVPLRARQVHRSLPSAALEKLAWPDDDDRAGRQFFRSLRASGRVSRNGVVLRIFTIRLAMRRAAGSSPSSRNNCVSCSSLYSFTIVGGSQLVRVGPCACRAGPLRMRLKPRFGIFELPRGDTKIEKRAADRANSKLIENADRRGENSLVARRRAGRSVPAARSHAGSRQGPGPSARTSAPALQKRFGVAAATTGAIDNERTRVVGASNSITSLSSTGR